jgi:uncharacterized protein (DUF2252 family)
MSKRVVKSVPERIKEFNSGRTPELLKLKYRNMRQNAFVFYRGSCHLFYEDLPSVSYLNNSPLTWICGDLHLENFGSYKADNRLVYFDINDFDESALAPCLWDVARLMISINIAKDTLKTGKEGISDLGEVFLKGYTETLKNGYSRLVQKEIAKGMVKKFLETLENRNRRSFIENRTIITGNKKRLKIDNSHIIELDKNRKREISETIYNWAKSQPDPEFYKVLDVGIRIAGTGSLGLERYVLLVEGKGSPNRNYLLDLKIANPSCMKDYLTSEQPKWKNQADRIINIQKRMQAFPLALLSSIKINDKWFVLKALQPAQDKLDLRLCKGKLSKLEPVIKTMSEITAWDQLRSSGRQGSAMVDELIEFAYSGNWKKELNNYCLYYTEHVKENFKQFSDSYDDGFFGS